jgi:hypothetical protein
VEDDNGNEHEDEDEDEDEGILSEVYIHVRSFNAQLSETWIESIKQRFAVENVPSH